MLYVFLFVQVCVAYVFSVQVYRGKLWILHINMAFGWFKVGNDHRPLRTFDPAGWCGIRQYPALPNTCVTKLPNPNIVMFHALKKSNLTEVNKRNRRI